MREDRFLTGILIGIALIAAAALGLFFLRDGQSEYGPEDTPEGVTRNYLVALYNEDFDRAYRYLAEDENKPTPETFRQAFLSRQLDYSNFTAQTLDASIDGDEARVSVQVRSGGLLDGYSLTETALLTRQDGEWKLTYMPYPFWMWDWFQPDIRPEPKFLPQGD
ncbi:MAG TPA: hypothetical protein GYA06_00055 [Chloroflexi bacterium]|jgi:hypothetical protein|nr:hypothetical protein [Chloroflexota bacterium]HPO57691.1 hypothetical protein [Anaerolineaceae bacterium]